MIFIIGRLTENDMLCSEGFCWEMKIGEGVGKRTKEKLRKRHCVLEE